MIIFDKSLLSHKREIERVLVWVQLISEKRLNSFMDHWVGYVLYWFGLVVEGKGKEKRIISL